MRLSILDPSEVEFEKVVFTKNVALAMPYHAIFEKLKKNFLSFLRRFSLGWSTERFGRSPENLKGLSFGFDFFSTNFRCSKGVKTNGIIKCFSELIH